MLARRAGAGDARALHQDAEAFLADTRVLGDIVEDLLASATMTADCETAIFAATASMRLRLHWA
jgi:hypothetical protein